MPAKSAAASQPKRRTSIKTATTLKPWSVGTPAKRTSLAMMERHISTTLAQQKAADASLVEQAIDAACKAVLQRQTRASASARARECENLLPEINEGARACKTQLDRIKRARGVNGAVGKTVCASLEKEAEAALAGIRAASQSATKALNDGLAAAVADMSRSGRAGHV